MQILTLSHEQLFSRTSCPLAQPTTTAGPELEINPEGSQCDGASMFLKMSRRDAEGVGFT